ncbi:MAG: acyl-ACP--UDP-N-acetylglucosamine O-acyltransferase [Gammaproteobacteria bacterium]
MIHPTAVIDDSARIAANISVGAYSVIGAGVEIAAGTEIGSHVVLQGPTRIGRDNRIFQFSSIGADPQDKKYSADEDSFLEIGDGNTIREFCSINRGTAHGGGITRLGNQNWIMAYVHIAHDCIIGNSNTFANNATLAGHVTIDDHITLGGFTGVHQFCHIGSYSFAAISAVVVKDVPPYMMVAGNTAKPHGLNNEGLKRHGFSSEELKQLRRAYRLLYREGLLLQDAIVQLEALAVEESKVQVLVDFIRQSERGIVR